jgi:hypothetical protein
MKKNIEKILKKRGIEFLADRIITVRKKIIDNLILSYTFI